MKEKILAGAAAGFFLGVALWAILASAEEKRSVTYEFPPQVQILSVDCYFKVLKEFGDGKPALHFDIKVKNISDKAERFSVMVSTPDGASAAGFVPARAKKAGALAVLDPQEEGKITLPLLTEQATGSFALVVEIAPAE